jgi:tetratricopeptide (TPR) repeat protein
MHNPWGRAQTAYIKKCLTKTFLLFLLLLPNQVLSRQSVADQTPLSMTPLEQAREFFKHSKNKELLALVEPLLEQGAFKGQERLEVLNMITRGYIFQGDFNKAEQINDKLQLEALHSDNNLYVGRAFINRGEILQRRGLFVKALEQQRQGLNYYRQSQDKKSIANALLEISYSLTGFNQSIEALNYANQSLAIGEEIEDLGTIASAYYWHDPR